MRVMGRGSISKTGDTFDGSMKSVSGFLPKSVSGFFFQFFQKSQRFLFSIFFKSVTGFFLVSIFDRSVTGFPSIHRSGFYPLFLSIYIFRFFFSRFFFRINVNFLHLHTPYPIGSRSTVNLYSILRFQFKFFIYLFQPDYGQSTVFELLLYRNQFFFSSPIFFLWTYFFSIDWISPISGRDCWPSVRSNCVTGFYCLII